MLNLDSLRSPQDSAARAAAFIQLATIAPFVSHLGARRLDVAGLLGAKGLSPEDARDPERLVQADVVYELLEDFATAAGDPWLGVHVGEGMDLAKWPVTQQALSNGATLGEMLTGMVMAAPRYGSSVHHALEIGPDETVYRVRRQFRPRAVPLQTIGFGFALTLRLLDMAEGGWAAETVTLETPSARALPKRYRGVAVTETGGLEQALHFPTGLLQKIVQECPAPRVTTDSGHQRPSLLLAIQGAAPQLLAERPDNMARAMADTLDLTPEELDDGLSMLGTSLARELRRYRLAHARRALAESPTPIAEIAETLGFSAPANFTRFFKSNTGETPRAYRRAQQKRAQAAKP
ncbi:DNA-binding transcriptional regulator AraC [Pseudoruegeria aquimaris]|uniref:DNA-binding transcriptional regulator AraC n=1 Tax=Pseudoruegeria aquimaris TaxID=393663 RepID=A0A1Y5SYB7_9RHOB|nr:helix-turn-helix domain-containing protein [Pseudoruegeria aquimaris]SLN51557.1 DNA-binding transcriptional regulator AraC [Pseudoruegeria aquimaris]